MGGERWAVCGRRDVGRTLCVASVVNGHACPGLRGGRVLPNGCLKGGC